MVIGFKDRKQLFGMTGNMQMTREDSIVQYESDNQAKKNVVAGLVTSYTIPLLTADVDYDRVPKGMSLFQWYSKIIEWCEITLGYYDIYKTLHSWHIVSQRESWDDVQLLLDAMHDMPIFEGCDLFNDARDQAIRITCKFDKLTGEILSDMPQLISCHCEQNYDLVTHVDTDIDIVQLNKSKHVEKRLNGRFVIITTEL